MQTPQLNSLQMVIVLLSHFRTIHLFFFPKDTFLKYTIKCGFLFLLASQPSSKFELALMSSPHNHAIPRQKDLPKNDKQHFEEKHYGDPSENLKPTGLKMTNFSTTV